MRRSRIQLSSGLIALLWNSPTKAQEADFSEWFPITEFPNAQADNLSYWQGQALRVAGTDLWADYAHRCVNIGQKYPELGSAAQSDGFVAPARPFDSVFFVGASSVSVWAIDTGDGLILIDSMWNAAEAEQIVIPGLQSFGYDGFDIKALIISHEHIDHYGGAAWLQKTYGMPLYASELAWAGMAKQTGDIPTKDRVLRDCDKFTVGNTTLRVYHTPGHSPGCLSFLIPLYDHGEKHIAGFYGGGGVPKTAEDKATQIESFQRFSRIAKKHGADVLLTNHQAQDHSLQHFDALANRKCKGKECSTPNPYVLGTERYVRWLKVMELCVRINAARIDQALSI